MNKEEILARSRSEAVDEGLREAESRGDSWGLRRLALWNWRLLSLTGLTAFQTMFRLRCCGFSRERRPIPSINLPRKNHIWRQQFYPVLWQFYF